MIKEENEKKTTIITFLAGKEEEALLDDLMRENYTLSRSEIIRRILPLGAERLREIQKGQ